MLNEESGAVKVADIDEYMDPGQEPEKAVAHLRAIEQASGLEVTGLVSNSHLIRYTTAETVTEGWEFAKEVEALSGVPALCACCMESIALQLANVDFDVFPIGMYMRDTYLDKQV